MYDHTLFIKSDGSLWGVGENLFGKLGQGDNANRNSPVQILASGVKEASSGGGQSLVVKTDGTLWVTGKDDFEQLGLGCTAHWNTLNQIAGVTGVSMVMAGGALQPIHKIR